MAILRNPRISDVQTTHKSKAEAATLPSIDLRPGLRLPSAPPGVEVISPEDVRRALRPGKRRAS